MVMPPPAAAMERNARSPQSRHRKRRLLEATQHVSPAAERAVVVELAAQTRATAAQQDAEAVNVCLRALRNVKNSVYLRALAARALGLLMLESHALAERLRLEAEEIVDALLQLVGFCRRSCVQTADTRRVHVNCCLVISLVMRASQQQQHLQLVVSLDSELLVMQSQPSEQGSECLLLTVSERPESGGSSRVLGGSAHSSVQTSDRPGSTGIRKPRAPPLPLSPAMQQSATATTSTNQHSPPRRSRRRVAWSEHSSSGTTHRTHSPTKKQLDQQPRASDSSSSRLVDATADERLAAGIARRETPSRTFKMDRFRVVTPAFTRLQSPLTPLPLIKPTGDLQPPMVLAQQQLGDDSDEEERTAAGVAGPQIHSAADALIRPEHMLKILRTHRMPLASPAYFKRHLRDEDEQNGKHKKSLATHLSSPSRLQVVQWEQWREQPGRNEDENVDEATAAVVQAPKNLTRKETVERTPPCPPKTQVAMSKPPPADTSSDVRATSMVTEAVTPAFKRQRLREILSSPVEPNEQNAMHLRALAERVNTSVMTSLGSEIDRARLEEQEMRQELHSMIQQERDRLPLKFLFQLPGGAAYCRHRMRRAMALWVLEFEDNQRRMALLQWKAVVEHARFQEHGEEYQRLAAKKRLQVAIEFVLRGYQQQGFRKWLEATQELIWRDRDHAAQFIQRQVRRQLGRERLLWLHRQAPFASPVLRDLYLSPRRRNLLFELPPEVREDRRALWRAAEHVQSAYRRRRFRAALARYRAAATKIQALQRMRAARAHYHQLRHRIVLFQARIRMRVCRDDFLALRDAALLVQAVFRSVRMRRLRRLVLCAQRQEFERALSATALLQRMARGFLGRCVARELRRTHEQEWHAALVFQRCWYARNNEWSTFLLLGCLREKEGEERAFDAQVLTFKRNYMAKLIRRAWLAYLSAKRFAAAELIQRNARRHAAQRLVQRLRRRRMAHRRIKWFFRVHHAKRLRTATRLQFWWLQAVPGRLRRHLSRQRLSNQLEDARCSFEREQDSSTRIQALVRGHKGRHVALCERSARSIQRGLRAYLLQKHLRQELARIKTEVASRTAAACIATAVQSVFQREMELRNTSAREIQRLMRGFHCRMQLLRSLVYEELQTRMASRIQLTWRLSAHRRAARRLLQAQRRKQSNPFRSEVSLSAVVAAMRRQSAVFFDPVDELRGMAVAEWLRRLGLGVKYGDAFQKNRWLSTLAPLDALQQLRQLGRDACEDKLEAIGVQDAQHLQAMVTSLFATQTIEQAKQQRHVLALAREKQMQLQRACDLADKHLQFCEATLQEREDALHDVLEEAAEFRHPPKALRRRQDVCTRELEEAVANAAQAREKLRVATARRTAQARELATSQQLYAAQQEPLEVSAVHSLRCLKLVAQPNVARELFLERFPGLDARALTFAGALGEQQVTLWQLERFFEAHATVSEVKLNMKELTFFALETEVKKHDHARFSQCADVLQFGHERLGELLGLGMETLVLGVQHGEQLKDSDLLQHTVLATMAAARKARSSRDKAKLWRAGADTIEQMDATAHKLQRLWRRRAGKKLLAALRTTARHQQLREQYLTELHADRVTPLWEAERKKEQDALDAWMKDQAKAHRLQVLAATLRFPYVEEWDSDVQAWVYAHYTLERVDTTEFADSQDIVSDELQQVRHYELERPTYTIEEEDAVIRVQAHVRRFLAQRHTSELLRLQRRQKQRDVLQAQWDAARHERAQLFTLTLQLHAQGNAHVRAWLRGRLKSKSMLRSQGGRNSVAVSQDKLQSGSSTASSQRSSRKGRDSAKDKPEPQLDPEAVVREQQRVQLQAALSSAVEALAPAYHGSVRAEHRRNWSFPVRSRPANAHGRAIGQLLERLQDFQRQAAPVVRVATKLRYTLVGLRFGWEEVRPTLPSSATALEVAAARPYFVNTTTHETSWERPDHSFDEQFAAIRIQSLARLVVAMNVRERELAAISLVHTVQDAVKRAARLGWVGYALEGMTSAVFLHRFGLAKHAASALGKLSLAELLATVSSEQQAKKLGWSKEEAALVSAFPRTQSRRFPLSCARETSVAANIKHPFNFLPLERVATQLVSQSFPNQQGRVVGLLRALQNSTTPISYRQLEMHLRKFAGRPDEAVTRVGEVASLTLATREPQEKAIFVLFRRCAERCVVFAANLGLSTLQRELSVVLRMPRRLLPGPPSSPGSMGNDVTAASSSSSPSPLPSPPSEEADILGSTTAAAAIPVLRVSPEEEERCLARALARYPSHAVKGLWEHEAHTTFSFAQMALYLREEALERVLAWERSALLTQTLYRMLRVRRWYVATQKFRAWAATVIQCAWRCLLARELRTLLESQQQSAYEQRLDKRSGSFYFVYMPTDEKLLEEPRDERTGAALPFRPMVQDRLTKRWLLAWPHYTPASRRPRPSTSKLAGTDSQWTPCSLCTAERAARRCHECYSRSGDYVDFCLACFYDRHAPATTSDGEDLSWHAYTALQTLRTPFFRCVECSRASTLRCLPCDEHYCERCFSRVHARGKTRSRHAREWYAAHAPACVECETRVACQRCLTCQDALCEMCMARTHARGRRAEGQSHTMELLPQPLDPDSGHVYCEQCQARRGDERCGFCAQTLCAVCRWSSSSSSTGAKSSRHALVCVETALAEKRRELLGDRGLCVECGKVADRECVVCGDRYCSVRWMGNPGCFERFHSKGKRADHTFTVVEVPVEIPAEILALEEQVRAKRRRDAEDAEHEAKRMASALLEDEAGSAKKKGAKSPPKKTKKSKSKKRAILEAPGGRKTCAVELCRKRALALGMPGAAFCAQHFTLQHALEVTGQDPLEAARLLAFVEKGGGRVVKTEPSRWKSLLPSAFFSRGNGATINADATPTQELANGTPTSQESKVQEPTAVEK